jgi:hypothetical protein
MKNEFGFRIAIRAEGAFVNAYYAKADTMDGALLLGSIHQTMVEGHDDILRQWMSLLAKAFTTVSVDMAGVAVAFSVASVPEHERTKLINHDIS